MVKFVSRGCTTTSDAYLTPGIQEYIKGFLGGFDKVKLSVSKKGISFFVREQLCFLRLVFLVFSFIFFSLSKRHSLVTPAKERNRVSRTSMFFSCKAMVDWRE